MADVTAGNTYRVDNEFTGISMNTSVFFGIVPKKGIIIQVRKIKTNSKDIKFALYEGQPFSGGTVSTRVFNADASVSDQSIPEDFFINVTPDNALADTDIKFFQVSYEGAEIEETDEYTLKAGTSYVIEVENRAGQNANLYVSIQANLSR